MLAVRRRLASPAFLVGAAVLNAAGALALADAAPTAALLLALLPVILLAGGALVVSDGRVLLLAALTLPLFITTVGKPLPVGGSNLFLADVIVLLAIGAFVTSRLIAKASGLELARVPRTAVLGVPFGVFAVAVVVATVRGHYAYGANLFGQPLRLLLYSGMILTLAGVTAASLHRTLTAILYTGTLVTLVYSAYYIATGTSQTDQDFLSTGGLRVLGISTTLYMGATTFMALLNLRLVEDARRRALHLAFAAGGLVGVAIGFGRAVYLGVGVVCLGLFFLSKPVWRTVLSAVPLVIPVLVLVGFAIQLAVPDVVTQVTQRATSSPENDANVQWRVSANKAVLQQVKENPLFGVGFGRPSTFFIEESVEGRPPVPVRVDINQDPHNGYLFLLAGGGIVTLGSFLLMLCAYVFEAVWRFRGAVDDVERIMLIWGAATLFTFLLNAASGTMFESPQDLLAIWTLLVLPVVVPRRFRGGADGQAA